MLTYKNLEITYCDPNNHNDKLKLKYALRDTNIAKKWLQRVLLAQELKYTIDDPTRFYGFDSKEKQENDALQSINSLIDKLENFWKIPINKRLNNINDQDTLNFLHHIFEINHGLYNQKKLNPQFQKHISQLNILVHRCENITRGVFPNHVVTYFNLPRTEKLENEDFKYFVPNIEFGTVYLNYTEIGKTLFDLMVDNDQYIDATAFKPWEHFSADFVVHFHSTTYKNLTDELRDYYLLHQDFFESLGYNWDILSRSIGNIPVADLVTDVDVLTLIKSRQFVKAVEFS